MIDLVLGRDFVKGLTVLEYWLMIFGLTPILIFICTLTFKYIETLFINKGKNNIFFEDKKHKMRTF